MIFMALSRKMVGSMSSSETFGGRDADCFVCAVNVLNAKHAGRVRKIIAKFITGWSEYVEAGKLLHSSNTLMQFSF